MAEELTVSLTGKRMISVKEMKAHHADLKILGREQPREDHCRPTVRSECPTVRPCPYVSCRHNLYLDVHERSGSLIPNYPGVDVGLTESSCVLDLAETGGLTLDEVGEVLGITRERVRQIEAMALKKLRGAVVEAGISKQDVAEATRDPATTELESM